MKARAGRPRLPEPAQYRTRLLVFFLISALLFLVALLNEDNDFVESILVNSLVVFLAVVVVQLLWDFMGGDLTKARFDDIERRLIVLGDAATQRTGIERIW